MIPKMFAEIAAKRIGKTIFPERGFIGLCSSINSFSGEINGEPIGSRTDYNRIPYIRDEDFDLICTYDDGEKINYSYKNNKTFEFPMVGMIPWANIRYIFISNEKDSTFARAYVCISKFGIVAVLLDKPIISVGDLSIEISF